MTPTLIKPETIAIILRNQYEVKSVRVAKGRVIWILLADRIYEGDKKTKIYITRECELKIELSNLRKSLEFMFNVSWLQDFYANLQANAHKLPDIPDGKLVSYDQLM